MYIFEKIDDIEEKCIKKIIKKIHTKKSELDI